MPKHAKICLILIFILAFSVRAVDLGTHFVHYDDATMATDILKAQQADFPQKLLSAVYDTTRASYNDKQKVLVRWIHENNKPLFYTGMFLARFLIIPLNSTNAPAQFFLTSLLLNENQSYRAILFLSRLPSFLFSLVTIFLIYLILHKRTSTTGLLLGLTIAALSLSSIIYAKQSYTYAIGCCAAAGLLLLFQYSQQKDFFQKHWILSGLLTSFFVYTHYQLAFFLPAYYLANTWFKRQDKAEITKLFLSGSLNFLLCLPALYLMLSMNQAGLAYYYLGANREFLFLPNNLIYPFIFFLKNSFLVITHTLAPVTADKIFYWLFGGIFSLSFIYGLKKIYRQPESIFIILSLLTYLGLVVLQKIALSPSRQTLVYLPLFIYVIANGLPELNKKYLYGILILYLGIFFLFFPSFIQERQDKIQETKLNKILSQYQPDLIIGYDFSTQPALLPIIRKNYNYLDSDNLFENKPLTDYKTVLFFSTRSPLEKYHFQNSQESWNNRQTGNKSWTQNYNDYKIIHEKILTSNIGLEPNNWVHLGKNELFLYILTLWQ